MEILNCKQRNNKILTWYGRRNDIFFANQPLTGVTITFIRCLNRVTGVSIGQGVYAIKLLEFIYSNASATTTKTKLHSNRFTSNMMLPACLLGIIMIVNYVCLQPKQF